MTDSNRDGWTTLDDTEDYRLVVGVFDGIESVAGRWCYGIVNLRTQVVEAVGPGLPSAMTTLYGLQADLDGAREAIKRAKSGGKDHLDDILGLGEVDSPGFSH